MAPSSLLPQSKVLFKNVHSPKSSDEPALIDKISYETSDDNLNSGLLYKNLDLIKMIAFEDIFGSNLSQLFFALFYILDYEIQEISEITGLSMKCITKSKKKVENKIYAHFWKRGPVRSSYDERHFEVISFPKAQKRPSRKNHSPFLPDPRYKYLERFYRSGFAYIIKTHGNIYREEFFDICKDKDSGLRQIQSDELSRLSEIWYIHTENRSVIKEIATCLVPSSFAYVIEELVKNGDAKVLSKWQVVNVVPFDSQIDSL